MIKEVSRYVFFLALLFAASTAFAQVKFPPNFDAPGDLKGGLEKFRKTAEGKAEEQALIESGVKIVITSNEDKENFGTTQVTARDAGGSPTEIEINIAPNAAEGKRRQPASD